MPASTVWNRKPLPQNLLAPLPATAIRPAGWLAAALRAQTPASLCGRLLRAALIDDKAALDATQQEVVQLLHSDCELLNDDIRALLRYHAMTADKNAAVRMLQYAKSLRDTLNDREDAMPPERAAAIADLLHMSLWLYNLTGQRVLLDFCHLLKAQAPDWMSTLHIFPQTKPVSKTDGPLPGTDPYFRVHGPTIASSLCTPALQSLFEGGLKNETAFDIGWDKLMRYHGAAHGLFNADPLLAGSHPSERMDPAIPSEMLYTLYTLLWIQGNPQHGDLLEKIVHGPLCATGASQAANQLTQIPPATHGLEQFASSLWMATQDGGLAAIAFAPGEVRWRVANRSIRIQMETGYPYDEMVSLKIHSRAPVEFPLRLRIPSWTQSPTVQINQEAPFAAEPGTFCLLSRQWAPGDTVTLMLPAPIRTITRYHQSISVERGPLIYALPVIDDAKWNWAIPASAPFRAGNESGIPVLYVDAATVPAWTSRAGTPAAPPIAPVIEASSLRTITLFPYGRTQARIAQFPVGIVKNGKEDTQ